MAEKVISTAIITPSFRGDLTRCKLLCRSMDHFVTGNWHHYIIVEEQDFSFFRSLASARRTVLKIRDIVPNWLHHVGIIPFSNRRSLWFSFRTGWMIGWHVQQLVKISIAMIVEDDIFLCCDSDVIFVRSFNVDNLYKNGRVHFYRSDLPASREAISNPNYLISASNLLGLGKNPFPSPVYVDNLVSWYRPVVLAMCTHIEKISGKSWIAALGRHFVFSEYSIYGLFADRLLTQKDVLQPTGLSLCKTAWEGREWDEQTLTAFCDNLQPEHVAVGFQSFLGVDVDALSIQLDHAIEADRQRGK